MDTHPLEAQFIEAIQATCSREVRERVNREKEKKDR